ncbi:unnamed protein product [Penicillium viridicatum]
METIAGNLPTKGSLEDSKVLLTRLSRFPQSLPSVHSAASTVERRDGVLRTWAMLLHMYLVSDTVAFAVLDTGSEKLAVSHYSMSISQNPKFKRIPELTFTPFEANNHRDHVNTAVSFVDVDNGDSKFSYILQSAERLNRDLRLYTQHTRVPRKFASALWNSLLKIYPDSSSGLHNSNGFSISDADQEMLRSFLPHVSYESTVSVLDLWRESVRTAPLATALESWDGALNYLELDALTNKLAHQLLLRGLQPGSLVPFSFEKVEAKVILVSPSQASKFTDMGEAVLSVSSDTFVSDYEEDSRSAPLPHAKIEDAAVCIFTSGSTGSPKGIIVQHGALATRLLAEGGALGFRGARCLQFAATTWDIFITDVLATFVHQGCVCIPSEEDRLSNLAEFCANSKPSLAIITPSLANMLTPESFPTLKTLVFSGEALRADVVARWSSQSSISLYQGYGPAETGGCIIGRLTQRPEILGYALKNYICVLVDPKNHECLVPIGAVGELLVAGPGLLRDYIGDSSRTNAAIVQCPSWCSDLQIQGTRFYKTGDLLRYSIDTLDGSLEFVGRTDGQVKYHGQRVEVGEIEHHLGLFPNLAYCMVTLVKEGHWQGHLVAVAQMDGHSHTHHSTTQVTMHEHMASIGDAINGFLSERLPKYMIPSKILVVNKIPFNASMKLDRAAINKWILELPAKHKTAPNQSLLLPKATRLLPHESIARAISKIYGGIVGNARRFEDQDFKLQSGGIDSIQIMSFSMSLRQRFGVQIPMAQLLNSKSTIRTIASFIDPNTNHPMPIAGDAELGNTENDIDDLLRSVIITPEKMYHNSDINHVFLTGASGYLGIEILRQLLVRSPCEIYALVQGSSETAARDYLIQKAVTATWWRDEYLYRVHVWRGDLSQPPLGLGEPQWGMLQGQGPQRIDAVIHNGAKVHYHMDYDSLKATNVQSTIELLKATHKRERPLHSLVFVSGGQQLSFDDNDDTANMETALQGSGYARSKAISELTVARFAEQAETKVEKVRIVKPGFTIGDAERGLANKDDFIWRYIAASLEIGAYDKEKRLRHRIFEAESLPIGVAGGPTQPSSGVKEALLANINRLIENGFFVTPDFLPTPLSTTTEDNASPVRDAFDVESVRKQFPALREGIVVFNNAAGTAVYQGAIETTHNTMSSFPIEIGLEDPRSQERTEHWMKKTVELAAFMNAASDEVASAGAWVSLAKDIGIAIKWWAPPTGDDPCLSLETLKPLLTPKTRIVACNHVSNVLGTINPIRKIASMVHSIPGAILIVDGVAWAPHRPIDVNDLDVDFYCFSWYKVFGPHIAQLYGRRSVQKRMLTGISHFFLGEMPGLDWRLRLGSPTFELEDAAVAVARYLGEIGWEKMIAQETVLQEALLSYLRRQPSVFRIFGEKSSNPHKRVSVITFQVIGQSSREIMNRINRQTKFRIVSGHCWAPRPTHDVLNLESEGLIRVSFVHYNTVEEVREFCEALQRTLESI